nr:transcription/repair factor TFIIH subunit Tfb3 [Saccharomyces cerevisiae]
MLMDEYEENNDMCPICKTDRYLSPDVKFLVNPECYHRICESCVDRIFSLGPAQCPYKGCDKILRKNKFKTQIFDDVEVEKEVDIRKRVFNVFNKTIDDFNGDLVEYNKYLEEVEDIIYKLDHGIDVAKTEEKLRTYEELNKQLIMNNLERSRTEIESFEQRQKFEKEMKLKKRLLERQIEEEERMNKEWTKKEIVNRLSTTTQDINETIEGVKNTVKLKKSSARRKLEELNRVLKNNPYFNSNVNVQNSRLKDAVPFTPFNVIEKHTQGLR